jgi:hypothetical protein
LILAICALGNAARSMGLWFDGIALWLSSVGRCGSEFFAVMGSVASAS